MDDVALVELSMTVLCPIMTDSWAKRFSVSLLRLSASGASPTYLRVQEKVDFQKSILYKQSMLVSTEMLWLVSTAGVIIRNMFANVQTFTTVRLLL